MEQQREKKSHHQIQRGSYTQWIDASKYGVHFLMFLYDKTFWYFILKTATISDMHENN